MPSIKRCTSIVGSVATFTDVVMTGSTGPPGQGVPVGGTANQVLSKIDATNYNTQWVTPGTATVADGSITNVKLATMPTLTMKGNATGATAAPTDLTAASVKTLLALVKADVGLGNVDNVSVVSGYQPLDTDLTTIASLTATTNNVIQSVGSAWASRTPTQLTATLDLFTATLKGLVPPPTTATGKYLKDDGTWATVTTTPGAGTITAAMLANADFGDFTVASGVATVDAGTITLAKMANLTQDQFIGRVTASTGVPETATITAAARTVLDDTTVAAMLTTLGGLNQATADTLYSPLRQVIAAPSAATSYTIALADESKLTEYTAATAIAISVPTNATLPVPVGYRTDFFQSGAGKITVAAVTPGTTTIIASPSAILRAVGSAASLTKVGTDRWLLAGDLT
jgi:hypothetical protein